MRVSRVSFDQLVDRALMDVREIGFHVKTPCPRINIGQRERDES